MRGNELIIGRAGWKANKVMCPLVPFSSVELVEAVEDIFVRAEDVASKAITEEDNS